MLNVVFLKGCLTSIVLTLCILPDSLQIVIDCKRVTYWVINQFSTACVFQTILRKEKQLKMKQECAEVKGPWKVGQSSDCWSSNLVSHFVGLENDLCFKHVCNHSEM